MTTKRAALVGVALALGLTACAHHPERMSVRKPDPKYTTVYVVDDRYLVVDQEPIRVRRNDKNFPITWQVPDDSAAEFPDDGVVIANPAGEFDCSVHPNRKRFTCKFRNSVPGQKYKYTIRLREPGKALDPLDPIILND